jgi:DNA-directed RNA polymerase subunit RPC12/RpoP
MKILIIECPECKEKISLNEDDLSNLFNKPSVVSKTSVKIWEVSCLKCGRIIQSKDTFQAYLDEG